LCFEINELIKKNINIEIIALQETWDVKYPDLFPITGFNPLICKRRRGMRGGGLGFYVKEGLRAEILENLSPFENKIIEALTIQLSYLTSNKKILLTSLYRSNGIIANVTQGQQIERFFEKFSHLLSDLKASNKTSFIFTDSNINLLKLHETEVSNYMNVILGNGYFKELLKRHVSKMIVFL